MQIHDAIKFIDKKIAEMEQQVFVTETIIVPRHKEDVRILHNMKDQRMKLSSLEQRMQRLEEKKERGEEILREDEVTTENIIDCLPEVFR